MTIDNSGTVSGSAPSCDGSVSLGSIVAFDNADANAAAAGATFDGLYTTRFTSSSSVTYQPLTVRPFAAVTDPGTWVHGTVPLSASATNCLGSTTVAFQSRTSPSGSWSNISGCSATTAGKATLANFTCNWTPTSGTNYDLQVIATDHALSNTSAIVSGVSADNTAPVIGTITPATPFTFPGASTVVAASVTDTGGSGVGTVTFALNGTSTTCTDSIAAGSSYSCDLGTLPTNGTYTLTVTATDNAGNTASKTQSTYTVTNSGLTLGAITSPTKGSLTLTATPSSSHPYTLAWAYSKNAGTSWTSLSGCTTATCTVNTSTGLGGDVIAVGVGGVHACELLRGGSVRCWGRNTAGEIGDGTLVSRTTPVPVVGVQDATAISLGAGHTCAIVTGGAVLCWGTGTLGELGNGSAVSSLTPVTVTGITNAIALSAGQDHSCVLLADHTVWCWGWNGHAQIGDGTSTNRLAPVQASGITTAVAISAGPWHTCAVLADGTVRCWGSNSTGRLGDGTTTDRSMPVQVSGITTAVAVTAGGNHSCAVLADGTVRCWGYNSKGQLGNGTVVDALTPVVVNGLRNVTSITADLENTCARTSDGRVACWGDGGNGQAGDGSMAIHNVPIPTWVSGMTSALSLSAGFWSTCTVLEDATAACWGDNGYSQLGDGTSTHRPIPVAVSGTTTLATGSHTACVRGTDAASHTGDGTACTSFSVADSAGPEALVTAPVSPAIPTALTFTLNFSEVATGLAVGDLSLDGTATGCSIGMPAGSGKTYTVAVTGCSEGSVSLTLAAGSVSDGPANLGPAAPVSSGLFTVDATVPQIDAPPFAVASAPVGTSATVSGTARDDNGVTALQLRVDGGSWQPMHPGGTAYGSSVETGTRILGATITGLSSGLNHTCAVLSDGRVACWGWGGHGQLGIAGAAQATDVAPQAAVAVPGITTAVEVSASYFHTCARLADGTVRCWGYNYYGQLGNGSTDDAMTPVTVTGVSNAAAIAAGAYQSCAALATGAVKCWGRGDHGELGNGGLSSSSVAVTVTGISTATAISGGSASMCALLADGTISCWGSNTNSVLGVSGSSNRTTPVSVTGITTATSISLGINHACAVLADNSLRCWGYNVFGQLGNGTTTDSATPVTVSGITTALAVTTPEYGSCVLLTGGGVSCWGNYTIIGTGGATRSTPASVAGAGGVAGITGLATFVCVRLATGTASCWGQNSLGELGASVASSSMTPVAAAVLGGPLAAGAHTLCIRGTDAAGNQSDGMACSTFTASVAPEVTGSPQDQSVLDGEQATFTASASGIPTPTVTWQVLVPGGSWADVPGESSATLTFTAAFADNGNQYRAVFTNDAGSSTSAVANLAVRMPDQHLVVELTGAGSGTVASEPGGITCGMTCAADFEFGTLVTLTATADPVSGSTFTGWLGANCPGTDPCTVTMNDAVTVTAVFADTTAPVVTVTAVIGTGRAFPWTTSGTVTSVGGACSTYDGPVSVRIDGVATDPATTTCSAGAWTLTLATPLDAEGTVAFVASQTDAAANTGHSAAVDVSIVRHAPTSAASVVAATTTGTSVSVDWTAVDIDGSGITSVTVYRSTGSTLASPAACGTYTGAATSGTIMCTIPAVDGTYYLHTRATDAHGKTETAPDTADASILRDTLAPVLGSTSVGAGERSDCVVLGDGTVRCWGSNDYGQLGDGTLVDSATPVEVHALADATSVGVGYASSCALVTGGTIDCWGYLVTNAGGVAWIDDPVELPGIADATQLALGLFHGCARISDGTVQCWGNNDYGELGDGTRVSDGKPAVVPGITDATAVSAGASASCAILADGSVRCWGRDILTPTAVPGVANVVAIETGWEDTCAIEADGTAWCWLNSTSSSAWTPAQVPGIAGAIAISVGYDTACAVLADHTIGCWRALESAGFGTPTPIEGIADAESLSASGDQTCALLASGAVRCWTGSGPSTAVAGLEAPTIAAVNGLSRTFPWRTAGTVTSVGGQCATGDGPVSVSIDGSPASPGAAACVAGHWTLALASPLDAAASYDVVAAQTDVAGNAGGSGTKVVVIDRAAPVLSEFTVSGSPIHPGATVQATATADDPAGVASAEVRIANGEWLAAEVQDPGLTSAWLGIHVPLPPDLIGDVQVCIRATDSLGNVSDGTTCVTRSIVLPTYHLYVSTGDGGSPETGAAYRRYIPALIRDWRRGFGQGDLP
ncbi:MAG: hypothetical protein WCK58_10025, partial [Chloroflexota bacterium]